MVEEAFESARGRFIIRPYQREDEEGVLSLWQKVFEKDMPLDLWRWKYIGGPFRRKILLCIDQEGEILALYGGVPYRARLEGHSVEIIQLMDIMSHPDYRGEGLFLRTAKAFFDRYCKPDEALLLYGFPGKYHFNLGEKYLEYKGLAGGISFLTVRTRELGRKTSRFGGRVMRIKQMDTCFDHLWERCSSDYPFSVIRDVRFVEWRFFQHPRRDYEIWVYSTYPFGRVKAYGVFLIKQKTARIVDIVAPYSRRLICDFLNRVGKELADREIEGMETWLPPQHFITNIAISAGFAPNIEPLGIIPTIRAFEHCPSFQWISDNIFYTLADGDLV